MHSPAENLPILSGYSTSPPAVFSTCFQHAWQVHEYNLELRRIARYIFNALTVLSLVMCIWVANGWVRSYVYRDYAFIGVGKWHLTYESCKGRILVTGIRNFILNGGHRWDLHPADDLRVGEFCEHHVGAVDWTWTSWNTMSGVVVSRREFAAPYWLGILVLAAPAIVYVMHTRVGSLVKRGRLKQGLCTTCGYDLRATPERCPECGTIPTKKVRLLNGTA